MGKTVLLMSGLTGRRYGFDYARLIDLTCTRRCPHIASTALVYELMGPREQEGKVK